MTTSFQDATLFFEGPLFNGLLGGSYIISMVLSCFRGRPLSFVSIHSIKLIFAGTNQIFVYFIPDSVKNTLQVFECFDGTGIIANVYLDMGEVFADYAASSQVIEVKKHMAGALCA